MYVSYPGHMTSIMASRQFAQLKLINLLSKHRLQTNSASVLHRAAPLSPLFAEGG
jgi:hypothetical protein